MRRGTAGLGLLVVLFMFLFIFEPVPIHASTPIVFDSSATNNCAGCTSLSWSHTVGAGSNGILIVGLSGFKNDPATSVTFGPKSLSRVGSHPGFANVNVELWALLNPSSACAPSPPPCTATVTVTITGGNILAGGSVSYFNVGGTGTVASADDGGTQGTTGSVTVSSSNSGDLVVDAFGAYNNVATSTASQGSGQNQRWNTGPVHPIAIAFFVGGGSDKPDSSYVTMTWSFSASTYWSLIAVPLIPALNGVIMNLHLLSYKVVNVQVQVLQGSTVVASKTVTLTYANPTSTILLGPVPSGPVTVKISGYSIATQTRSLTIPPLPQTVDFAFF